MFQIGRDTPFGVVCQTDCAGGCVEMELRVENGKAKVLGNS